MTDPLEPSYKPEYVNSYQEVIRQGVSEALEHIYQEYEQSPETKNNLDYHNTAHTIGVIRRTELILKTIQTLAPESVSDHEIELGILFAAYHDTVQNWQEVSAEGSLKRQRFAGANERASLELLQGFMDKVNSTSIIEVFSQTDKQLAEESILITIPGWNPEAGTVIQPNLSLNSSIVARAIALADLGAAGIEGPDAILSDSATIFREDNLDIKQALQQPESLSSHQKEAYRQRILAWLGTQSSFVTGRKNMLDQELQGLPEKSIPALKELFNCFDEAIETMNREVARRQNLPFEDLTAAMGYQKVSF